MFFLSCSVGLEKTGRMSELAESGGASLMASLEGLVQHEGQASSGTIPLSSKGTAGIARGAELGLLGWIPVWGLAAGIWPRCSEPPPLLILAGECLPGVVGGCEWSLWLG